MASPKLGSIHKSGLNSKYQERYRKDQEIYIQIKSIDVNSNLELS